MVKVVNKKQDMTCPDFRTGKAIKIKRGVETNVEPKAYQTLFAIYGNTMERLDVTPKGDKPPKKTVEVRTGEPAKIVKPKK